MIKKLYVIGNGFDIHHGINSRYADFHNWAENNRPEVIEAIETAYGECPADWWYDFENQLATLDTIEYGEQIAFENQPDLASEHCDRTWNDAQIAVEQSLDGIFCELRICFHDWIIQLNRPIVDKKVSIDVGDSVFLNFNYTKTLENLYGITPENILHIHGCVDEDEDFVIGHGKSYRELESLNAEPVAEPPDGLSPEDMELFFEEHANDNPFHEQLAKAAALSAVAGQSKPVRELIEKYSVFFKQLADVEMVHVYGMSFSEVDEPYLMKIAESCTCTKWIISDYQNNNRAKIDSFIQKCGISNYEIISLEDIMIRKQLSIQF